MTNRLIRIFIAGLLIFSSTATFAQNNNTTSPFSRFGLGDLHTYSYGRFSAMGGASLGSRHQTQINSANPASYTSIDSLSFLFEFGADGRLSEYKSSDAKFKTNDANFKYFSMSWPVTRWFAAAMGVQPFADKGYEIYFEENKDGIGRVGHSYYGNGTISKAYFGAGINLTKSLSVGTNIYYLFGTISQNRSIVFPDDPYSYNFREVEKTRLRDFAYMLGVQYDIKLKNDDFLTIGATLDNKPKFTAFHDLFQGNYLSSLQPDTISNIVDDKSIIQLPTSYGIGVSYTKLNKLEVNADYYTSKWSKATFFGKHIPELTDQSRVSIGAEYIPNASSIKSYYSRIKFRAGLHIENTYLKIDNHQIRESGMSFGVGLPVSRSLSTVNFAVEFGRRGTTAHNLIRENYTKISLYLTLYDRWFIQRKFD